MSYEFGRLFDARANGTWPLSRHPISCAGREDYVRRYGVWGVFFGRFFGPLRALVPLVAGVFAMPRGRFQTANVASACLWAFGLLAPGAGLLAWLGG